MTAPRAKAAPPPASRHGVNCRCSTCKSNRQSAARRARQVPRTATPKPRIKLPPGWSYAGPIGVQPEHQLKLAWDDGKGVLWCTPHTVDVLLASTEAMTDLIDALAEAVEYPLKVVMRDVSAWADNVVDREAVRNQKGQLGIKMLTKAVTELAAELAALQDPTEHEKVTYAQRYGRLRDNFAILRKTFMEAEGGFEIVQEQISRLLDAE